MSYCENLSLFAIHHMITFIIISGFFFVRSHNFIENIKILNIDHMYDSAPTSIKRNV